MTTVTLEQIKKVGKLSRLKVSDEEAIHLKEDLSKIVTMVEKLNEVDASTDKSAFHLDRTLQMNDDKVTSTNISEQLGKNAPKFKYNFFEVPKVIE